MGGGRRGGLVTDVLPSQKEGMCFLQILLNNAGEAEEAAQWRSKIDLILCIKLSYKNAP